MAVKCDGRVQMVAELPDVPAGLRWTTGTTIPLIRILGGQDRRTLLPHYPQPDGDAIENLSMAVVVDQKHLAAGRTAL